MGAAADDVTPAPRQTTTDTAPHPLLDGLDQRKPPPATTDKHLIDKLLGVRQTGDTYSANVRFFLLRVERRYLEATGEPPPQHGCAFSLTEEETCTGVRLANAATVKSPTSRAHNRAQRRYRPHVDTHYPTCPCHW